MWAHEGLPHAELQAVGAHVNTAWPLIGKNLELQKGVNHTQVQGERKMPVRISLIQARGVLEGVTLTRGWEEWRVSAGTFQILVHPTPT